MIDTFFSFLGTFEDYLWGYVGVPTIMLLGIYLSYHSNFVQVRKLPIVFKNFFELFHVKESSDGVHPIKVFFASVGGCVGIGNIVGICTAAQLGGPGALFWIWVTALVGMVLKYSEVYLGLKYRVANSQGGFNGGPMYFLQRVFKQSWVPKLVCFLLCVYGVEVFQFSVIVSSVTTNFDLNQYLVIGVLLFLVIFAGSGGVRRVGSISSAIIPLFVVIYVGMGLWVLLNNITVLPHVFAQVFSSAFTPHAAIGGFMGVGIIQTISHGVRRGCYTGDVGVGYASVIHSETSAKVPEKQASLAIFDIFLDTFMICTTSVLLILSTDVWHQPIEASLLVQTALDQYFPYMHVFMPFFLFLLGYSTINAYFCVGIKCSEYLSPKSGRYIYYGYAIVALFACSFVGAVEAQTIMSITGLLLLLINSYGIFRLRHEISFNLEATADQEKIPAHDVAPEYA
jgi:alanine or glycine:cation symporter, AGCS family